jgi:hypothetical protein
VNAKHIDYHSELKAIFKDIRDTAWRRDESLSRCHADYRQRMDTLREWAEICATAGHPLRGDDLDKHRRDMFELAHRQYCESVGIDQFYKDHIDSCEQHAERLLNVALGIIKPCDADIVFSAAYSAVQIGTDVVKS